jgi:hypothetical protein
MSVLGLWLEATDENENERLRDKNTASSLEDFASGGRN